MIVKEWVRKRGRWGWGKGVNRWIGVEGGIKGLIKSIFMKGKKGKKDGGGGGYAKY